MYRHTIVFNSHKLTAVVGNIIAQQICLQFFWTKQNQKKPNLLHDKIWTTKKVTTVEVGFLIILPFDCCFKLFISIRTALQFIWLLVWIIQ